MRKLKIQVFVKLSLPTFELFLPLLNEFLSNQKHSDISPFDSKFLRSRKFISIESDLNLQTNDKDGNHRCPELRDHILVFLLAKGVCLGVSESEILLTRIRSNVSIDTFA